MKRLLLRVLRWGALFVALLIAALVIRGLYVFRDRSPGYTLSLKLDPVSPGSEPVSLRVGFGKEKINPDLSNPAHPVWVAGFGQNRKATAIHDDLWAIACVLDDGHRRLGIVALDAIGFFHDEVIAVRRACRAEWKLDYVIVCSTHNHSTPDLMGLWGPDFLHTGVDKTYRGQVIAAAAKALGEATAALGPCQVAFHEITVPTDGLVSDTRKPIVFDPNLRVMHFTRPSDGSTVGTIVGWANHPETPWGNNTELTADYCGYLRDTLEHGFTAQGKEYIKGVGGTHLYINGAIGGLMTTHASLTVHDPFLDKDFKEPSHDKARAVGNQLAIRVLPELTRTNVPATNTAPIGIRARTFDMPVPSKMFFLAAYLGLIDRGHTHWKQLRTEAALITIGNASIACIPGEIYPEIVNGGIEKAPGGDFDIDPVEVPPIRELMPGSVKFIFGLANDELGYLIPKSEWDEKPPYIYGAQKPVYGEINSCGSDAARFVHAAISGLCREAKTINPAAVPATRE